ncbi:MAG: NAD(+)/NADH kinase [Rhodocyclaceae bacterium]|nr:NAD(+)/NADH kinase [Rhodocyclaceae bacterium]
MSAYRRIVLFGKAGSADAVAAVETLHAHLRARGIEVLDETAAETADVAIVIGGDGTLLSVARKLAEHDVPLVGINQGRLGFMTDIARADMLAAVDRLLAGEFTPDRRMLLDACVLRDGQEVFRTLALNEVVVNKGDLGRMIEMEVRVDGEFLYVLRADGMIVATPTGSTAYALSANGPILQPAVPGIALVPLCAHALTYRPITIADSSCVELKLVQSYGGRVHCDGQSFFDAKAGDTVRLSRSSHAVILLHPPGYSYFAMLREKLHWSATPHR